MNPPAAARRSLLRRIRIILVIFTAFLVASGVTAMPVEWEINLAATWLGLPSDANPADYSGLQHWIAKVRQGLVDTGSRYPFIAYGFDWLAFAHIVIAVLFLGAIRDPVRNIWVITFGIIACVLVIPWSLLVGPFRGIPTYWSLIDCTFGVFGIIPLWLARRYTVRLAVIGRSD
jgi:hypothetical protein